eukprot:CAMPEP_0116838628 /NCGR_PEP_ID=MMETSP0418-20121206/9319_1 /TAXON_ID=1158023 /ORGANISM="Astrosyne radiata, Strain 13vi08-1A" /LENGTH=165 /DNA_ID=CAMNT_0004468653 /DNA_START=9 /DNA_END=506 /DNA_ORIENTATION=-
MMRNVAALLVCLLGLAFSEAFAPQASPNRVFKSVRSPKQLPKTALGFGLPSFGAKDEKEGDKKTNEKEEPEKKGITFSGLVQLIAAGLGSPFLGSYEGIDPETGRFMFSLEANNFVDENGNSKQTQMPYFESGWVSEEDMEKERKRQEKRKKAKEEGGFKFPWEN